MKFILFALAVMCATASVTQAGFFFENRSDETVKVRFTMTFVGKDAFIYQSEWKTVSPGVNIELDKGGFYSDKRYWVIVETPRGIVPGNNDAGPGNNHFVRDSSMIVGLFMGYGEWGHAPKFNNRFVADSMRDGNLKPLAAYLTNTKEYKAMNIIPNGPGGGHGKYTLFNNHAHRTDRW